MRSTTLTSLQDLIERVKNNISVKDKIAIHTTHAAIGDTVAFQDPLIASNQAVVLIGDDCAAIPDGHGGYMLFAAEGIIPAFVQAHPWFAGYSAVMVNISDVCAMGGLPLAVTDVLWLQDQEDGKEIWAGMQAASQAYGVPIVGGHTCYRSEQQKHLSVAVLGKASQHLLTSYDAQAGDTLLMAIDLNGGYFESYPFWNASTSASSAHLQAIMRLPYEIAEKGLSSCAKDISMGGIVGTLAMLLHTSGVGAQLDLGKIPKPPLVDWEKWLLSFPSYGYLLTAKPDKVAEIQAVFQRQSIACEPIGEVEASAGLTVSLLDEQIRVF